MKAAAQPDVIPVFDFTVDEDAQHGDYVPALARLLIQMVRRHRKQEQRKEEDVNKSRS